MIDRIREYLNRSKELIVSVESISQTLKIRESEIIPLIPQLTDWEPFVRYFCEDCRNMTGRGKLGERKDRLYCDSCDSVEGALTLVYLRWAPKDLPVPR